MEKITPRFTKKVKVNKQYQHIFNMQNQYTKCVVVLERWLSGYKY